MRLRQCAWVFSAALLCASQPLLAQDRYDDRYDEPVPAHITVVEGSTSITREGEPDVADAGMPVVPGDVVRTDRGRLQILLPEGSAVDLDEYSTFELLSPTLFRLSEGRARVTISGANDPRNASRLTIDTPLGSAEMFGPGEFRVALFGTAAGMQAALDVIRGNGRLSNERGSTSLRAGEQSLAVDAAAPTYPRSFNSARFDDFDQWSAGLRTDWRGGASAQYLPSDLRMYGGALDRNGSWSYERDYGYVWYPTVTADWRPYDDGYWAPVPRYGWTWIGVGVWSWPTHHYGRWGYQRDRWFWIPDRQWAPAWVSWGAAPGYVSWCPLGYDNRPVFALSVSTGGRWDRGWTVIDREHFGRPRWNARQYSVRSFPANTPFVQQSVAPVAPRRDGTGRVAGAGGRRDGNASAGYAVPRNAPRTAPSTGFPDRDRGSAPRGGRVAPGRAPQLADDARSAPPRGAGDSRGAGDTASRGDDSSRRSGAVPRNSPRDSVIYQTPVQPGREARPLRDSRNPQRAEEPPAPAPSFSPAPPVEPARPSRTGRPGYGATERSAPSAPDSFYPARPVAPAAPDGRARDRRGDRDQQPPSSFEPARPTPPPTSYRTPPRASASAPPQEARPSQRAEPRSGGRADRPARDQGARNSGQEQDGGGGDNGGGRARRR